MSAGESQNPPGPLEQAEAVYRDGASLEDAVSRFAGYIVRRLFLVGLSLDSARSILGEGPGGDRVAAAAGEVDRMIRDIRTITFGLVTERGHQGSHDRSRPAADDAALLRERMVQTARSLQAAAADYAALLEQRADLAPKPGRMDYPAEIKRWRAFADQAEHMAKRWEQPPQPAAPPDTGQDRD